MDLDFNKKLIDCTLGEYLAAERTIGIFSGWIIALFTVGIGLVGRLLYKKWQSFRAKKKTNDVPSDLDLVREKNSGPHTCKDYSPHGGFFCSRNFGHEPKHHAENSVGEVVASWD